MVQTAAGTVLSIGTTATTASSDSYTAIGSLSAVPETGDEYDNVSFESLSTSEYVHNTGAKNVPSSVVGIGRDLTDAGQVAVRAANGVNSYYNFRLTYPDGSFDYYKAKVQGYRTAPGGLTGNIMASIKLQPKPGSFSEGVAGAAPTNAVIPAISGIAQVGVTLTAQPGTWTGNPTFTYQWKLDGANISGATDSTYVVLFAQIGSYLSVAVTGTNAVGNATATSAATADVIAA
jgi:hypothetical protein